MLDEAGGGLQHLRRFAKVGDVPVHVREALQAARSGAGLKDTATDSEGERLIEGRDSQTISGDAASTERLLIVGCTSAISHTAVIEALSVMLGAVCLFATEVPLLAPTSQEQATLCTSKYWPTVYKKSNPFGPHPGVVSRAEEEIRDDVDKWMDLAFQAAHDGSTAGLGEAIGVVVVERKKGVARPVAVAADARWLDWVPDGPGNTAAHAVLRAVAMVAEGLRGRDDAKKGRQDVLRSITSVEAAYMVAGESIPGAEPGYPSKPSEATLSDGEVEMSARGHHDDEQSSLVGPTSRTPLVPADPGIFRDQPMLAVERDHHDTTGNEEGYLCHDLELYTTHEPCVMCAMAVVHSRFGRAIFAQRMPETGGLWADGHLGHGLFWRKELNWTLLAWQYSYAPSSPRSHQADRHVPGLHA